MVTEKNAQLLREQDNTAPKTDAENAATATNNNDAVVEGYKPKYLNFDFLCEVMSIPSYSRYERRMQLFIIRWARKRDIRVEVDKKGNLYLTKGTLDDGEFYPCLTSHMDTVQDKAKAYVEAGVRLEIKQREKKVYTDKDKEFYHGDIKHEIYVDSMGIGADDKAGVFISLSIMEHFDKIKAAFFVEEEVGMMGSHNLDKSFFEDCGYCIGWDSPDLNRAAYKCAGTKIFSAEFHKKYLKPICDDWGLDDFRSEPCTDISEIRKCSNIMCMNFGNGGYEAHRTTEYMVVEDTDHALGMGIDLVKRLGNKLYKTPETSNSSIKWVRDDDGSMKMENNPNMLVESELNDERYFDKTFHNYYYCGYNQGPHYNTGGGSGSISTNSSTTTNKRDDSTIAKYIIEVYDKYVGKQQLAVEELLKEFCTKHNIEFETELSEKLKQVYSNQIKF